MPINVLILILNQKKVVAESKLGMNANGASFQSTEITVVI